MSDERDLNPQRAPLWPPDPPRDAAHGQPQHQPHNPFADQRDEQSTRSPGMYDAPPTAPSDAPQGEAPTYAPQPWPNAYPAAYGDSDAPFTPPSAARPTGEDISEARTERISAVPPVAATGMPAMGPTAGSTGGPPPARDDQAFGQQFDTPDLPTERVPAAPGAEAVTQQTGATEQETPRRTPAVPAFSPPPRLQATGKPVTSPTTAPSQAPAPTSATPAPKRGLNWRWKALAALILVVVIAGGLGGLYLYAADQAAAPVRVITQYCAATKRGDYQVAYSLLSSDAQAQTSQAQYIADAQARDTIQGRVVGCDATPAQALSALSFLRAPRSVLFNARITRGATTSGQIALNHDATGWHVAALSAPLQGIDLEPLHTEQALCQALAARSYTEAFALLSTPYQREQGSAATFTHDFGSDVTVTACAPNLKAYSVNAADQRATLDTTMTVSVAAGGSTSTFPMPAKMALVREAAGWRVDAITPLLSQ